MKARVWMLAVLLGVPSSVSAADFSEVDLDPLLRVRTRLTIPAVPPAPAEEREDADTFVTRGGATTIVRVIQLVGPATSSTIHQLARGIGSPEDLVQLTTAIAEGRIGQQRSCFIESGNVPTNSYDVTWYGRGARRNSFVVVFGAAGVSSLPPCGPGVLPMLGEILRYESDVLGDPATELFTNE